MTADALIVVANEFLASRGATLVSKRTLRFYTAQEVVPSPMGSPKFARYGFEHLLSLLAARSLQDQGQRLEQIRRETVEIQRGRLDRIEGLVETWLHQERVQSGKILGSRGVKEDGTEDPFVKLAGLGTATIRVNLSPNVTLEVSDSLNVVQDLTKAQKELERILSTLGAE